MVEARLSAGVVEYEDSGGDGPVVVLLHGFFMDGSLWDGVVSALRGSCRCVVPTLPLGAHRRPMRADANLSPEGIARLVGELLERLDLQHVTLVGNDTGGVLIQLLICAGAERVDRVVLASCEAFENFPPGLPGKASALSCALPGGAFVMAHSLRLAWFRRLPVAWGWMSKRVTDDLTRRWAQPLLTQPAIRRDASKAAPAAKRQVTQDAAKCLPSFTRPALVLWAAEDRVMPPEHGTRLAQLLPDARHVVVPDSYTLIALDQPDEFARHVREFLATARA